MTDGMTSVALDAVCVELEGAIVAGFGVHRRQNTFDAVDTRTGEPLRGKIESTPAAVERWVGRFPGRVVHVAVEACTGWLFVAQALERAGAVAHLAEPVARASNKQALPRRRSRQLPG